MAHLHFSKFTSRLHKDKAFRERFAKAPAQALIEEGYDPTLFALPDKIDLTAFERRLEAVFGGKEKVTIDDSEEISQLSPSELWSRFSVIGLTEEAKSLIAEDDGSAMAVVVYGSSMAVSNSNVAVTVEGRSLGVQSIEQLEQLRRLSRLSREQLTFSITGPEGVSVKNVGADVISAFLTRLGKSK